jgi:regulatory protein
LVFTMDRVVTDLKIQNKNKNRTSVYLDGEFGFGIANGLASSLRVGQELSEIQIVELIRRDEFEVAYHRADHFIGYRPRTAGEVSRKLQGLKYSEETIRGVIQKYTEQNILDDEKFASQWVEERSISKPRGKKLLALELHQKGVDQEIIQEALKNIDNQGLALKAARDFVQKLILTDWNIFRQKVSSFLIRRGFEYSEISPIVEKVWEEKRNEKINVERGKI